MGLFSRFFNSSARKLIEQMRNDTDVIQIAVSYKLLPYFITEYGPERGLTITAAVANKLFAKVSPKHGKQDLELAVRLATDILKNDDEVRYAALISCRAILLSEADKNSDNQWFVWDTIQWMSNIWDLPPDEATPVRIREIARTLHNKYIQK